MNTLPAQPDGQDLQLMNVFFNDEQGKPLVGFDVSNDAKCLPYIIRQCCQNSCKWCGNSQARSVCSNMIPHDFKRFNVLIKFDYEAEKWKLYAHESIPEGALICFFSGTMLLKKEVEKQKESAFFDLIVPPTMKRDLQVLEEKGEEALEFSGITDLKKEIWPLR